jgi:hypothetical protein
MKRTLLIATAIAAAALAGGSQPRPAPDAAGAPALVHVAFMMGSRGEALLPAATGPRPDNTVFDGWDPTADNPELENLLGLSRLAELARVSLTMRPDQRFASVSFVAEQRRYELAVEAEEAAGRVLYLGLKVKEDGKDVSQPRMGLQLGQKGVVCARVAHTAGEVFVFFVLQVDTM